MITFVFLFFYVVAVLTDDSLLTVNTTQGKVQGLESISIILNGTKYYSFLGIPYAKPPVGKLRFQSPVPAEKWIGTLNATKAKNPCHQTILGNVFTLFETTGDEDCLYLNVYTPQPPSEITVLKAVMVWIHGGGFTYGSGSPKKYSPDFLMNQDIILVTLNYRLHAFGFLNLGIPSASGNCGLKDQTLALKWVQQNILRFGGDPDRVTLFGESAGGASVQFHAFSPLSKGLFHKIIVQSAHALSQWAVNPNPIGWGFKLGRALGFQGNDSEELVQYLMTQPTSEITRAVQEFQLTIINEFHNSAFVAFVPSVEKDQENAFLPDSPENLIKKVEIVPMMIGFTENEGIINVLDPRSHSGTENDCLLVIKYSFDGIPDFRLPVVAAKVKEHYFSDQPVSMDITIKLMKLWSDLAVLRFYETINKLSSSHLPPYIFQFSYDGDMNVGKQLFSHFLTLTYNGSTHGDDVSYLFYVPDVFSDATIKLDDMQVIHYMCTMWTNFAKIGNPTHNMSVEWKPSTTTKPAYLRITSELKMIDGKINEQDLVFWTDLFISENISFTNSKFLFNTASDNEGLLSKLGYKVLWTVGDLFSTFKNG